MKEYRSDIAALTLLQIGICLIAALLCGAAVLFLSRWYRIMWIVAALFAGSGLILSFFLLPAFFRRIRCVCTSSQITLTAGIFFKRMQAVRIDRVQFVQLISGPFDGILGFNFIILYVYGGQLTIPFLGRKDRASLTAFLEERGVFHAS